MSNVTLEEIVEITAREFSISPNEMRARFRVGKSRNRPVPMIARNVAIWLICRHTQTPAGKVGRYFKLNTRTPIEQAVDYVETRREIDPAFANRVERIERWIDDLHELRVGELV